MLKEPTDLSILKDPKLILAQIMPIREGLGALIRPPTPKEQPPPWVVNTLVHALMNFTRAAEVAT